MTSSVENIGDIPYYVRFTFVSNNTSDDCYCLVSKDKLNYVLHTSTKNPVTFLRTGELITINTGDTHKNFKITGIEINSLPDLVVFPPKGLSKYCEPADFDKKELLGIVVFMDSVD